MIVKRRLTPSYWVAQARSPTLRLAYHRSKTAGMSQYLHCNFFSPSFWLTGTACADRFSLVESKPAAASSNRFSSAGSCNRLTKPLCGSAAMRVMYCLMVCTSDG